MLALNRVKIAAHSVKLPFDNKAFFPSSVRETGSNEKNDCTGKK
jgi:hypothetical protein